ncbi:MAG: prolipoprotein diacylglyceryl transferase [Planctomycetota bacterium]
MVDLVASLVAPSLLVLGDVASAATLGVSVDGAWVHQIDPIVVRLGPVPVRWYGLSYILGFAVCWVALMVMGKRGWIAFKGEQIGDLMFLMLFGVFIGGRLGYVLFYRPSLLWTFEAELPFWGLLAINQGGMASHGGMIGVLVATWWFARRNTLPTTHVMDAIVLVAPIGLFFGRVANFINGELLGGIVARAGERAPGWAVRYPQELFERFEEGAALMTPEHRGGLDGLLWHQASQVGPIPLDADPEDVRAVGAEVAISAIRAGDAQLAAELGQYLTARHPSQLYQALAEGVVTLAVVWAIARTPRRPGLLAGWFLIVYGVGRVATEFFRLPDAHFGAAARFAGLSRGQWLSVVMVAAGVALVATVSRRVSEPRAGGWLRRAGHRTDAE